MRAIIAGCVVCLYAVAAAGQNPARSAGSRGAYSAIASASQAAAEAKARRSAARKLDWTPTGEVTKSDKIAAYVARCEAAAQKKRDEAVTKLDATKRELRMATAARNRIAIANAKNRIAELHEQTKSPTTWIKRDFPSDPEVGDVVYSDQLCTVLKVGPTRGSCRLKVGVAEAPNKLEIVVQEKRTDGLKPGREVYFANAFRVVANEPDILLAPIRLPDLSQAGE